MAERGHVSKLSWTTICVQESGLTVHPGDFTVRLKLVCPRDRSQLTQSTNETLVCVHQHSYPIVDGIPVLLRDDVNQTIELAHASLARAHNLPGAVDERNRDLYLESLGISDAEKVTVLDLARDPAVKIDPVVSVIVGATSGLLYKHLIGQLSDYPIPDIRLPPGDGKRLLDVGCNWGRWSIAAARKGYKVVGIDPSLGAVAAARRVARSLDLDIEYLCADSRYLPFADASFDQVFSYSVIQHFSRPDALAAITEIGRTLRVGGSALVQMPNLLGIRNLYNLMRRGFSDGAAFDVRYWRVGELKKVFQASIGPSEVTVHGYFGLGLERSDFDLMSPWMKMLLQLSESLSTLSGLVPALKYLADSEYVSSVKSS
jgi:2-polyprenyl-3-methyl-5-hydroxy-6-metoxy-1,4-benzoquinol methylase/uncharacterized protein YbaR (Trm112 family)